MNGIFAEFSTRVNEKRRQMLVELYPTDEKQRIVQIVYLLYIENPYLHLEQDRMLKVGTCTLNRFEERVNEHSRNFSSAMSVMEIFVVPNASVEKDFHKMMETDHSGLVLPLSTVTGNFKEVYLYDPEVIERFYAHFSPAAAISAPAGGDSHT